MQEHHQPFPLPSQESIHEIVEYLPVVESIGPDSLISSQDLSGCDYHPLIESLLESLHRNQFVQPYDWTQWQSQGEMFVRDRQLVEQADLETCVRLITLHVRKERFCSGHFGDMIASGHISAILRRLADLSRMDPVH